MKEIKRMVNKINLQLFAGTDKETVPGSKLIYLIRVKEDAATEDAGIIAYTTSNGRSVSNGVGTTQTKDGSVTTPGTVEESLSLNAILSSDDSRVKKMEAALKGNKVVEVWEANLAKPAGSNKYEGTYWEGRVSSWSVDSPADGLSELSMEFALEGGGKTGNLTIAASQIEEASYTFKDTIQTGA